MRFLIEWVLPIVALSVAVSIPLVYLDGYNGGKSLKRQVCAGDRSEVSAQRSIRLAQVDIVYHAGKRGYSLDCDEVL